MLHDDSWIFYMDTLHGLGVLVKKVIANVTQNSLSDSEADEGCVFEVHS